MPAIINSTSLANQSASTQKPVVKANSAIPANRDPRLANRTQKLQHNVTNRSEDAPTTKPVLAKNSSSTSPPSKRTVIDPTAQKHLTPPSQTNGIKRSSPNSTPNANEVKKPKMSSNTSPVNNSNHISANESPLKPNKQFLNTTNSNVNVSKPPGPTDGPGVQKQKGNAQIQLPKTMKFLKPDEEMSLNGVKPPVIKQQQLVNPKVNTTTGKVSSVKQIKTPVEESKSNNKTVGKPDKIPVQTDNNIPGVKKAVSNGNNGENHEKKIPSLLELTVAPAKANKPEGKIKAPIDATKKGEKSDAKEKTNSSAHFANDVDERFILEDMSKQIDSFATLLTVNALSSASPQDTATKDSTSSSNKEVLNKLETNSNSLNELKERLRVSQEKDQAANQTTSSSNTQDIMQMIKMVLSQQKQLIDLHNKNRQEQEQKMEVDQQKQPVNSINNSSHSVIIYIEFRFRKRGESYVSCCCFLLLVSFQFFVILNFLNKNNFIDLESFGKNVV
jgi:hypothetical protein